MGVFCCFVIVQQRSITGTWADTQDSPYTILGWLLYNVYKLGITLVTSTEEWGRDSL